MRYNIFSMRGQVVLFHTRTLKCHTINHKNCQDISYKLIVYILHGWTKLWHGHVDNTYLKFYYSNRTVIRQANNTIW